jgi:hypothetical protein
MEVLYSRPLEFLTSRSLKSVLPYLSGRDLALHHVGLGS